jgi:hypothetical protein
MPQPIKYATTNPSNAVRKGNIALGVNNTNYGPSPSTGWAGGVNIPTGGYVINYTSGTDIRIRTAANDSQLITVAGQIMGTTYSTVAQALSGLTAGGFMAVNGDYPNIVTDGLTTNLDATLVSSYPNTGTDWYDLSGNGNNGSLYIGSPTFSTFDNKRSIRFSNLNKNVYNNNHEGFILNTNPGLSASGTSFTFEAWFYQVSSTQGGTVILSNAGSCDGYRWGPNGTYAYWLLGNADCSQYAEGSVNNSTTMIGRWVQMVGIFDRANTLGGGTKFYHYVNGELQGSVGTYSPTIQLSNPGMAYCCGAFDGYLSIVRVYNRALLQSEITQNFNAQKSYFGL